MCIRVRLKMERIMNKVEEECKDQEQKIRLGIFPSLCIEKR
ncbi:hypothetical protein J2S13_000935 [Oikeobacillus pervagus]|uniref:Uncharacterized protein n=1 Tax=Oikeobacillus pervagus TaxID=1325931 RepID=A0AAJ1T253_9BACI|nr:hypothetical protein [Oikeobacillus pervagus]